VKFKSDTGFRSVTSHDEFPLALQMWFSSIGWGDRTRRTGTFLSNCWNKMLKTPRILRVSDWIPSLSRCWRKILLRRARLVLALGPVFGAVASALSDDVPAGLLY